ncbi:putative UDP-glucose glucosyltransferase [Prunus yedoensis var. nudiflora]|uniref:Glycosyltransferase n=1 Tax=Prunus yedoensis var. nudiflora TaxID=2094558 RepID=A0A314XIA3_PRUYE|nr:putative UDP-glucose glucosyltransferase [Prunus yedoensis var. nudiflora]
MLRLGKRLAAKGMLVSFSTTENYGKEMRKANSDINDQATPIGSGFIRLELVGKDLVTQMIKRHATEGRPVSCVVNNPFIPWVCDVAVELGIPQATLWVQSCAVFSAYYHYNNKTVSFPTEAEPNMDVQLPGMPVLKHDEVPSFLHPSDPYQVLGRAILGQFKKLSKSFYVLMDTFHELEPEIIEHMSQVCIVKPVGPLFKNPKAPETSIRGDMMKADDCLDWLDSKPPASVVYISFGSIVHLKQEQVDEIAHGLLSSGVSFLWVLRPPAKAFGLEKHVLPQGFLEEVGDKGKLVQWSSQEQVLGHTSVACFLTHCGWNSSVEALTSGVPVVTFPQWGDQVTNAKFLVDVFGVGLRLSRGMAENRLVMRAEVEKCLLEATVGDKAVELRRNALQWKKAAEEAVAEGGSSDRSLEDFLGEISKITSVA